MTTTLSSISPLLDAVRALALACRFDEAERLLDIVPEPADDALAVRLSLARAETAHRSTYVRRTAKPDRVLEHLDAAAALLEKVDDPGLAWDVMRLRLQHRYTAALRHDDGTSWFGPDGRSAEELATLQDSAVSLLASAPDPGRRAWAHMLNGWISDNIVGDRDSSPRHYRAALDAVPGTADQILVFEAHRHLGDHAHDDGEHDQALHHWEESTSAAARGGHVSGVLAQQILLAVLARDAGDEAGAQAIAREVRRWAVAIDATSLVAQTETVLAGLDPTRPPEPARA